MTRTAVNVVAPSMPCARIHKEKQIPICAKSCIATFQGKAQITRGECPDRRTLDGTIPPMQGRGSRLYVRCVCGFAFDTEQVGRAGHTLKETGSDGAGFALWVSCTGLTNRASP